MAVGQGSLVSGLSYAAVGRNTTTGLGYNTTTANLEFLSASLKLSKESKILEQVEISRTFSKRIGLGRKVEGEVEFYANPDDTATNYIFQNAFGGAITSATATGETAGGAAFTHTYEIGLITDQSYGSLCMNIRKGDSAGAKIFEYHGLRVNELTFTAEIDEALKCNASFMGKDVTQTSNDVSSTLTCTSSDSILNFTSGRLSVETTFAGLTSTSFWHVQNVEFGLANSIKSENEARRIGSDTVDVLVPGMATFTFNATIRFDTTSAWNSMVNETKLSAQLEFTGDTLSGSVIQRGLKLTMPEVYVMEAGEPEIGGPDEILTSEVQFMVLRDCSSATGYAVQLESTNLISSFA